jgi:hypothetical protein
MSPNSVPQSYTTGSGTIAALNASVVASAGGALTFDITGTWVGTLTTQATNGDGTWINVASLSNQSGLIANSTTINGTLEMNTSGWTQARLTATAWTSGTATVTWSSTSGNHVMIAYQGNGINLQTNTALVDSNQNFIGVTPANTAPTASQEALVVSMSPNSITTITDADTTATGSLGALNNAVTLVMAGEMGAGMQLLAGSLIGTIVAEVSTDGGNSWTATFFDDPTTSNIVPSITFASANPATTRSIVGAGGASSVRVRVSAYTSGTATCNMRASFTHDPSVLFAGQAGSTAQPPTAAQIAGWDAATTTLRVPAVKSASTAAAATDQALVVTMSPNSAASDNGYVTTAAPTYTNNSIANLSLDTTGALRITPNDRTASGNLTAVNQTVAISTIGCGDTGIQIAGTFVGTVVFEGTVDGSTWSGLTLFGIGSLPIPNSSLSVPQLGRLVCAGFNQVRVRCSAYTSGTIVVSMEASPASSIAKTAVMQEVGASVVNSSTTPLAANGVFTGVAESTLGVAGIQVNVFSNVASAAGGLSIQQSMDGTNWDIVDTFLILAGVGFSTTVQATTSFYRVVYTNGPTIQTVFRLQTALCPIVEAVPRSLGQKTSNNSLSVVFASDQPAVNDDIYPATQNITAQDVASSSTVIGAAPPGAQYQSYITGTPTAGSAASFAIFGVETVRIETTGTWTGTLAVERSVDSGVTWVATDINIMGNSWEANNFVSNFIGAANAAGVTNIRVRSTTAWTGTATIRIVESSNTNNVYVGNAIRLADAANQTIGATIKAANTLPTTSDTALVVTTVDQLSSNSYPNPIAYTSGSDTPTIDAYGNLETRGPVLTDEGSFRDDFSGSALTTTLTGTLTFTNGSTTVTGVGTSFTTQVKQMQYIKQSGDSETLYVQVSQVISNTQLLLVANYAGTTTSGATGVVSNWLTQTGTGATISVSGSTLTIAAGTTVAAATQIRSLGDYGPYSGNFYCQISQRIANQTIYAGFQDTSGTRLAMFQFSGTNNTQATLVSSWSGAEIQATTITLPGGATTATYNTYKVDISMTGVTFSVNGVVVGRNTLHLPGPYDVLFSVMGINNSSPAPASSTSLLCDYFTYEDLDRLQVYSSFPGEPLPEMLTDGTNGPVAVKPASTAAVATDPALVVTLSPNSGGHIKGTIQPLYGTNGQSLTITIAGLTNGSAQGSTAVSNTTNLYEDVLISVTVTAGGSGTLTYGYVNIYAYGSVNGGTTYTEGFAGTNGAATLTAPPNAQLLGQMNVVANNGVYTYGPVSFCRQAGLDRLPAQWGVFIQNGSGGTLASGTVTYQGVNGQIV